MQGGRKEAAMPTTQEQGRIGRPKKQEHERRVAVLKADLTLAEKEYLRQQAAAAGLTEAEFARRRVLGYAVASTDPTRRTDPALITKLNALGIQLKAIGNNANQLARAKHTGRAFRVSWQTVAEKVLETRDEVSAVLAELVHRG